MNRTPIMDRINAFLAGATVVFAASYIIDGDAPKAVLNTLAAVGLLVLSFKDVLREAE